MSGFYESTAASALRLIKEKGRTIPIVRRENTSSDPVDGTVVTVTTNGTITAVVLPASKGTIGAFDNQLKDQPLMLDNMRYIIAAASDASFEPRALDEVQFDSISWEIIGVTPLSPAGIPIIYKMGARRR